MPKKVSYFILCILFLSKFSYQYDEISESVMNEIRSKFERNRAQRENIRREKESIRKKMNKQVETLYNEKFNRDSSLDNSLLDSLSSVKDNHSDSSDPISSKLVSTEKTDILTIDKGPDNTIDLTSIKNQALASESLVDLSDKLSASKETPDILTIDKKSDNNIDLTSIKNQALASESLPSLDPSKEEPEEELIHKKSQDAFQQKLESHIELYEANSFDNKTSFDHLDLIDISCWTSNSLHCSDDEITEIAKSWDHAFKTLGFALIKGHGISPSVFHNLNKEWNSFFNMEARLKLEFNHGAYGNELGGYTPQGVESVGRSMEEKSEYLPDLVESFTFNKKNYLEFDDSAMDEQNKKQKRMMLTYKYFSHMENILEIIHEISAIALGLPDTSFFDKFYPRRSPSSGNTLRFAHYSSLDVDDADENSNSNTTSTTTSHNNDSKGEAKESIVVDVLASNIHELKQYLYAPHTDYQGFTILYPDEKDWSTPKHGGLEIYVEADKRWVPVELSKYRESEEKGEILVINAGDLIQRWTNDIWKSTLHRVINSKATPVDSNVLDLDESNNRNRDSIVFFSGPSEEVIVEVLDLPVLGKPKYEPIASGDHLRLKLARSNKKDNY